MNRPLCSELQTAMPAETNAVGPLARVVSLYAQRIDEHRTQLERDLDFYRGKLAELDEIDPLDFTGLKRIYSNHVHRTRELLQSLDA
jgi:hypothetical protein